MDGFEVVNLRLLSHPLNWLFVWITLVLAGMAFHLVENAMSEHRAASSISPD